MVKSILKRETNDWVFFLNVLFACFRVLLLCYFFFKSVKGVVIIEGIYEVRDKHVFILVAQNQCCFYQRGEFAILLEQDAL